MDSDKLASMYAEVVNGKKKKNSRFVTDSESSRLWDEISEEVKAAGPKAEFSIPNEMP